MTEFKNLIVERNGAADFKFEGELVAFSSQLDDFGMGEILSLYRTKAGAFVTERTRWFLRDNERCLESDAITTTDQAELHEFFGYEPHAKKLYELAVPHIDVPYENLA